MVRFSAAVVPIGIRFKRAWGLSVMILSFVGVGIVGVKFGCNCAFATQSRGEANGEEIAEKIASDAEVRASVNHCRTLLAGQIVDRNFPHAFSASERLSGHLTENIRVMSLISEVFLTPGDYITIEEWLSHDRHNISHTSGFVEVTTSTRFAELQQSRNVQEFLEQHLLRIRNHRTYLELSMPFSDWMFNLSPDELPFVATMEQDAEVGMNGATGEPSLTDLLLEKVHMRTAVVAGRSFAAIEAIHPSSSALSVQRLHIHIPGGIPRDLYMAFVLADRDNYFPALQAFKEALHQRRFEAWIDFGQLRNDSGNKLVVQNLGRVRFIQKLDPRLLTGG